MDSCFSYIWAHQYSIAGADPGFFLRGDAPLRNYHMHFNYHFYINSATSCHVFLQHRQTTKFFLQTIICIRKLQVTTGGCTPPTASPQICPCSCESKPHFPLVNCRSTPLNSSSLHVQHCGSCCHFDRVVWLTQLTPHPHLLSYTNTHLVQRKLCFGTLASIYT